MWQDADVQLEGAEFWAQFSADRIATEAIMLDVRNYALSMDGRATKPIQDDHLKNNLPPNAGAEEILHRITPPDSFRQLQNITDAPVALKSNLNLEIDNIVNKWHQPSFPLGLVLPSGDSAKTPSPTGSKDYDVPPHYLQVVARLQREVLLLRNELNFELWLSKQNIKHIGRLFLDRSIIKSAETERQGLVS